MTPQRRFASPPQGGAAPAVRQSRPGGASRGGVFARREMLVFMAAGPLAGLARATHAGAPGLLPGARRQGQARLRFFGLSVYDATLWTEPGFEASAFSRHRFVLELHYLRTLNGKAIAERSLKEMRGVGSVSDAQATRWLEAMLKLFPDVKDGDHIAGLHVPGEGGTVRVIESLCDTDEGPRADAALEKLGKLRPVFAARGSVTAGNSSQMSDGAGAVLLMSEAAVKRYGVTPIARFVSFSVAGVPPHIMGIGPIEAIPRALKAGGLTQSQLDWIELNEAFAAQSLAVMRQLELDPAKVNPLGGAIALGHPLGATGAIRTATIMSAMQRDPSVKYGMVTMCIGTGMGAAGIFERV